MTTNENISSSNPTNQANQPSEALLTAIGLRFCSSLEFKAINELEMRAKNLQADNATMRCLKKVFINTKQDMSACLDLLNLEGVTCLPESLVDAIKVQAEYDGIQLPTTEEAFKKQPRLSAAEQQKVKKDSLLASIDQSVSGYIPK